MAAAYAEEVALGTITTDESQKCGAENGGGDPYHSHTCGLDQGHRDVHVCNFCGFAWYPD